MSIANSLKPTESLIYPRLEGNNICTWIGFKHVMYVVEESVVDHFRQNGYVPRSLYEDNGLCLEIVDSSARILHALHMDDKVRAEVALDEERDQNEEIQLLVNLHVERKDEWLKAVVCRVSVLIRIDDSPVTAGAASTPIEALKPYTVEKLSRPCPVESPLHGAACAPAVRADVLMSRGQIDADDEPTAKIKEAYPKSMVWKWHIPYFYCHYNERMKHSGYIRLMEEVEDIFLANNGISIIHMLHDKSWIPVVPTAQVEILEEALMEETLYTAYTLVDTYRDFTYTHRMDCFVVRDGKIVHCATGTITHGYARINDRKDWSLVAFDDDTKESIHKNLSVA